MWRYGFLKFMFKTSKYVFHMFSYVFICFRGKIFNVWNFCWRHPIELKFCRGSGLIIYYVQAHFQDFSECLHRIRDVSSLMSMTVVSEEGKNHGIPLSAVLRRP